MYIYVVWIYIYIYIYIFTCSMNTYIYIYLFIYLYTYIRIILQEQTNVVCTPRVKEQRLLSSQCRCKLTSELCIG